MPEDFSSNNTITFSMEEVREADMKRILLTVYDALKEKGCDAYYFSSFEDIQDFCVERCQKGDLLITMGAGDVVNIGEELLKR